MNRLEQQVQRLIDIQEIANLQGRYMYYIQSHDYEKIYALFARHEAEVSAEVAESGVYVGLEKIQAFWGELIKPLFTAPGSLPIHMLNTPVIEVESNGRVARGMWQTLGCNAFPGDGGLVATWQQGKYDNIFVKEDGQWRFKQFRWLCNFRTPHAKGWVEQSHTTVEPLDFSMFPERCWPSRPGEPHAVYNPAVAMDFGPRPPEPVGDSGG